MIAFVALLIGAVIGLVIQPTIPAPLAPYLPVAVVASLDALFGAVRARLEGTFSDRIFLVSFLSNIVLAVFLVFLGDQLAVGDALETAVIVVFGVRIFQNLAGVRRRLFHA
ncbi:MAG TPA: small basic family protein [Egibacteraceae bacterium]|nr:small basic family protein [Egibacteraceae bacterium]